MINIDDLTQAFYCDEKITSKLTWAEYIQTLSEQKQVECIYSCYMLFLHDDWKQIRSLNSFNLVLQKAPTLSIYTLLYEMYDDLFYQISNWAHSNTQMTYYLQQLINDKFSDIAQSKHDLLSQLNDNFDVINDFHQNKIYKLQKIVNT
jgi:hypothetical protein